VFTWIPKGSPIHLRADGNTLPALLRGVAYDWWLGTQNNAAPSHAFPTNFVRNGDPSGCVDDYSAPFIVGEAAEWLRGRPDPATPFFLTVWMHEPHYPIASTERYDARHAAIDDPVERTYRANVTQLDDAFGRLMKTLDELGLTKDTLVMFTSDNGPEGDGSTTPARRSDNRRCEPAAALS
jgi:arylsulfatase A